VKKATWLWAKRAKEGPILVHSSTHINKVRSKSEKLHFVVKIEGWGVLPHFLNFVECWSSLLLQKQREMEDGDGFGRWKTWDLLCLDRK
jgi:hypothetical protein